jgi:predicted phage tail protein
MQLIFHGDLRRRYGDGFTMHASSVQDAVNGFARQQSDWDRNMAIAAVGFDTEEKLRGPADVVHLMPRLAGGGGKFGSIILGAVTFVAGAIITTIPGGQAIGVSLMISGGLMMVQGVIQLFWKAPSLDKNKDPEASKYLPVNRNTTNIGTPITMAWGLIDLAGQWLSLQSDSSNLAYGVFPANPT